MKFSNTALTIGALLLVTTFCNGQEKSSDAFALHPDNPRYFQFRGEPTVLVTSAEHYGILLNTAFDYEAYFDELAECGLNHSRVFNGTYREAIGSFKISNNPLAPDDKHFVAPWARVEKSHRDGSPVFDLSKWNDAYFDRLKKLVADASTHGIVLEICLFSPMYTPEIWDMNPMNIRNNVNNVGDCGSHDPLTAKEPELLKFQTAFAQKMVRELLPFDNVYIEICNEPYWAGVTDEWQRKIIDAIVETQKEVGCSKLISVNVANATKKIVDPHPSVSIFNFHYCHPPIAVAENWEFNKPIGENETGFRGQADLLYRTEAWDFLIAGGAIYNNLDYSFSPKHPRGTQQNYTSPGGGSRELREQLRLLKQTFDRLPLVKLKPQANEFATASNDLVISAIGEAGKAYLVYTHVKLPGRLKDEPVEKYQKPISAATITIDLPEGNWRVEQLVPDLSTESSMLTEVNNQKRSSVAIKLNEFRTDTGVLIERIGGQ